MKYYSCYTTSSKTYHFPGHGSLQSGVPLTFGFVANCWAGRMILEPSSNHSLQSNHWFPQPCQINSQLTREQFIVYANIYVGSLHRFSGEGTFRRGYLTRTTCAKQLTNEEQNFESFRAMAVGSTPLTLLAMLLAGDLGSSLLGLKGS